MKRPNVIFVFSDEQRYSAMGCSGNDLIETPHMDKLAAEGACFEQAFSSCALCSPYRAQILSGRYSHANGVPANDFPMGRDFVTLPAAFKQAGYKTAYVGKWHMGHGPYPEEERYGFDYMAAHNCNHNHYAVTYHENEEGPFPIDGWAPTGETNIAMQYIEKHQASCDDDPFCLVLSWGPPHWGFSNGLRYNEYPGLFNIYDPADIDLPPNVPPQMADFARKEIAHYYGNVSALDREFGRLMEFLKTSGLEEDTIICFSSDHGDHLSSHGYGKPRDYWMPPHKRASKATPYDESVHIPFILRYPAKVASGQRVRTLLNSVDVMPTLLGLAGLDTPDSVQGQDLSHSVLGIAGPEPDSVYLQTLGRGRRYPTNPWVGFWRGLRTDRWTYARWHDLDQIWLFDRENDPHEMKNLAGDPDHAEIQQQLEQRLQQWIKETDDPFDTGQRDPETGVLLLDLDHDPTRV